MSLFNPDETVPCSACGENDFLPSKCTYCNNFYCRQHILDHIPCKSVGKNRNLTESEKEQLNKGAVTLDQLVTSAVRNNNRNEKSPQQQQLQSSTTTSATTNRFTQSTTTLGSALPPGLHRYKRLELLLPQK